jgi:type I restriction enzyme M protein
VALPEKLFLNTGIPVCLWFVSKNRHGNGHRARRGEVLFIDARRMGRMETRTLRVLDAVDIAKVAHTYHAWRSKKPEETYAEVPGFVKAATLEEITDHDFVLTPGRYVGAAETEDDGEPIDEKIARLAGELYSEFERGRALEERARLALDSLETSRP